MRNEEWIKDTNDLITDLESKRQILHDKYDQITNELMDLDQKIAIAHELISDYMNKHNIESVTPANIKLGGLINKSYPDMVIEIAKQSNGILNIEDATNILLENKIGFDRKSVTHNISNAIFRLKAHFKKIGRGQYRFTNHLETAVGEKRKVKTGTKQAVKNLKEQNPYMTVQDVLKRLKQDGFDFKGKKPSQSVNMAWVALGYSKEGKQLPMKTQPSNITISIPAEEAAKISPVSKPGN